MMGRLGGRAGDDIDEPAAAPLAMGQDTTISMRGEMGDAQDLRVELDDRVQATRSLEQVG
jgi:hypothetical protein